MGFVVASVSWADVLVAIPRGLLSGPIRHTQRINASGPTQLGGLFWAFVIRCLGSSSAARAASCPFRVFPAPSGAYCRGAIRKSLRSRHSSPPNNSFKQTQQRRSASLPSCFRLSRPLLLFGSLLGRLTFSVRLHLGTDFPA